MMKFLFYSVLFLLGLGYTVQRENAEEVYPIGVYHKSSIGNRKVGHVSIFHSVSKEKTGGYLYRFEIISRSKYELRFTMEHDLFEMSKKRIQPTQPVSAIDVSEEPPVGRILPMVLEVRTTNGGWQKVGTWHQRVPFPMRRK